MLNGAADESYVRACLIRAVEGVSEVAADLGIGGWVCMATRGSCLP
jgi:hypothetical protein